jgi:poly(3-hydroxybutyrate) depolymerase
MRGDGFPRRTGFDEWADANRILVLYPQARVIRSWDFRPPGPNDRGEINPDGCWNWWGYGYDDVDYLTKDGVQVRALWAMVQRVAGQPDR